MQGSGRQRWSGAGLGGSAEPTDSALGQYVQAVRGHWKLVLLVTLAALIASALWAQSRPDRYEATAQMFVQPLPNDDTSFLGLPYIRDTGDPPRTLQTAAALIDSQRAAAMTATRLGGDWTPREVEKAVDVTPQGQSSVVEVTAEAEDPEEAARVANRFVKAVLDVRRASLRPLVQSAIASTRRQLERVPAETATATQLAERLSRLESVSDGEDPTLSISQVAAPPTEASGTGSALVIGIALIAGLALGTILALVVELVGPRRVGDESELLGLFPLPVLARVPELPRRRWRREASPLATPPLIREGFRTLQLQLELQPGQHRSVLLTSASSGDGKTTSAINFALEMVSSGHSVVLMDLDLRKPDVGPALAVDQRADIAALAAGEATLEESLVPMPAVDGLRILPIAQQDGFQVLEQLARRLPELLEEALAIAEYVVIDTAPLGEVSDALPLVRAVDDVVLVGRLRNTRVANLETMRDLLSRIDREPIGWMLIGASARHVSTSYYYAGRPAVESAR